MGVFPLIVETWDCGRGGIGEEVGGVGSVDGLGVCVLGGIKFFSFGGVK